MCLFHTHIFYMHNMRYVTAEYECEKIFFLPHQWYFFVQRKKKKKTFNSTVSIRICALHHVYYFFPFLISLHFISFCWYGAVDSLLDILPILFSTCDGKKNQHQSEYKQTYSINKCNTKECANCRTSSNSSQ